MKEHIRSVVIFAVGAALGSAVTFLSVKKKYEKLSKEEIKSVREYYERKSEPAKEEASNDTEDTEVEENGYYSVEDDNDYSEYPKSDISDEKGPYVISPEEFGENDIFECISLTYYNDGVLADENDDPIDNIESVIGDALEHFGEYEDDAVYVCNERLRLYYEILKDYRDYFDDKR